MKLGYVIVYVADVAAALDFYTRGFGLAIRFLHESGQYGEMETGTTTLAFVSHDIASDNVPGGYQRVTSAGSPFGIELGFVTPDVPAAVARAVNAGAIVVAETKAKPWGQVVAYVRAPEGTLIEICTPIGD